MNTDATDTDATNTDATNTDATNTDAMNTDTTNTDETNGQANFRTSRPRFGKRKKPRMAETTRYPDDK